MIRVSVDTRGALRLTKAVLKQIPFAAAKALNAVALEARDVERNTLEGRFTIRRSWVKDGIQIPKGKFATKDKLETEIGVEPKRNFLNKFEGGGTKKSIKGGSIAVPEDSVLPRSRVIPANKRPKAFQFQAHRTTGGNVSFQGKQRRGKRATIAFGGEGGKWQFKGKDRTFIIEKDTYTRGIFQRTGRGGAGVHNSKKDGRIRLLYWFTRAVPIEPDLRLRKTVEDVVRRRWAPTFKKEFAAALRTARV